jgi:putative hydrolase of the HAD superfamily
MLPELKNNITTVILDYGGVISHPQNIEALFKKIFTSNKKASFSDFRNSYTNNRREYDRGIITATEYWNSIGTDLSIKMDSDFIEKLVAEDIKSWFNINEEMIEFIFEIRNKVKHISLLSNINIDCARYLRSNYEWLHKFDSIIFSCDLKILKPDEDIYKICLNSIRDKANNCLFIDDSGENVKAGENIGINGHRFSNIDNLKKEISEKFIITR